MSNYTSYSFFSMWRTRASTVFAYCIVSALYTSALAISGECAVGSSCILPVPQEAPPNLSAEENLKMIQCHLGCISKVCEVCFQTLNAASCRLQAILLYICVILN